MFAKRMNFKAMVITAVVGTSMLAGCGGGGGGSDGGSGTSTVAPVGVSVTSTNAVDSVAYAYSGIENINNQSINAPALITGVSIDSPTTGVIAASLQQLYKGLNAQPLNSLVAGVTTSATANCTGGGSISVTVNTSVSGQVSNGDSMSISANACAENGTILSGRLDFGFSNLAGTIGSSSAWSARLAINYANVSIQSGGETLSVNGDMALNYAQTGYQAATASVSGSSLQVNLKTSDGTVIGRALTAYNLSNSINGSTHTSSGNFTLAGSSSKLGTFNFTVKTNTDFTWIGTTNPSTGSVTVTAADKSNATLTVLDSTNVKISLDKNGDGVIDETINTTWADLRSRI